MFDFSKYKKEQEKIRKILDGLNGQSYLTSQTKLLAHLFISGVELPHDLKIDFSSTEEFSSPTHSKKNIEATLDTLIMLVPYDYWRHTINPSIFYNLKTFEHAMKYSVHFGNFDFIKDSFVQLCRLAENIPFDDPSIQNIYSNSAKVPYPITKIFNYENKDSYLNAFRECCSTLGTTWNNLLPVLLTQPYFSLEENKKKIHEFNLLEKFLLTHFVSIMGKSIMPKFPHKIKDDSQQELQASLDIYRQFQTSKDIDNWIAKYEFSNPRTYIQHNYVSMEDKYHDLSFSFYFRNKISNLNTNIVNSYLDRYQSAEKYSSNYKSFYNFADDESLQYVPDEAVFNKFNNLNPEILDFFYEDFFKNYLKSTGKRKVSIEVLENIASEVAYSCGIFNSNYFETLVKNVKASPSKNLSLFTKINQISFPHKNIIETDTLLYGLYSQKIYQAFKDLTFPTSINTNELLKPFNIFNPDCPHEEFEFSSNYLNFEFLGNFANSLNCAFKIGKLVENQTMIKTPVTNNYFLAKRIVGNNSLNQNLKFLKVIDFCETCKNKEFESAFHKKFNLFKDMSDEQKEYFFMKLTLDLANSSSVQPKKIAKKKF